MTSRHKHADAIKERIEARGTIAKDVNLDVSLLKKQR